MRAFFITLYIILGVWSLFAFETTKIVLTGKYLYGNFISNPLKISFYTIIILLFIFGFILTLNRGFINPIKNQIGAIEPIIPAFLERNYNVENFKREEFIKVFEKLNKDTNKNLNEEQQVLKFLENSKYVYQNLPIIIESETTYNTKVFNMNRITQATILKVEKYKHTIILISHNPNKPDRLVTSYNFEDLPDNKTLKNIVDPIFDDDKINEIRQTFEMWLSGGFIHGSAGLSVSTSKKLDGEWLWIGVPNPFNDYNLNNLVAESLGFQNRI